MLSKQQIKLIRSLSQKKYRHSNRLFVVEGVKSVNEFLKSDFELYHLYATKPFSNVEEDKLTLISDVELKKISFLNSPNTVLGLFKIPDDQSTLPEALTVVLDDVRDPGNLGTIIRLCDWYGVKQIVCSMETVDCYNAKVVQASMGSLTRVSVVYTNLESFLETSKAAIFTTAMEGENLYTTNLPNTGIVILGNEANGVSNTVSRLATRQITIPRFGDVQETESLNVANATAIILSEFKRRSFTEK